MKLLKPFQKETGNEKHEVAGGEGGIRTLGSTGAKMTPATTPYRPDFIAFPASPVRRVVPCYGMVW